MDTEAAISALEATGNYRVLRRLARRAPLDAGGAETHLGLMLDVETTGLDLARDEIIELCMVPFTFTPGGIVIDVLDPFHKLRQPSIPIPPAITAITGLDDATVAGHSIDPRDVEDFAAAAVLVIAHNAAFDRPMIERLCGAFKTKAWGCSMSQVDWAAEGFEGTRLSYLAMSSGFFYDRHKAAEDCAAAIELLATPLPVSGVPALAKLLEVARQASNRIWAWGSPFETKDVLKARGYRWNDGTDGRPKAWWIDVPEPQAEAEIAFLEKEIYRRKVSLSTDRITAFNRFRSVR